MRPLTEAEIRQFMRSGSRTGKLATVKPDGSAHIKPIWFDFDDATGDLVFLTGAGTVAARNLQRDPRLSVLVDEEVMPFAWARLDGRAEIYEDSDDLLHWATETCRRYVGDDRAEEYGRRNAVPGEWLIWVKPARLVGYGAVAD